MISICHGRLASEQLRRERKFGDRCGRERGDNGKRSA
jgi:hypothetical protein